MPLVELFILPHRLVPELVIVDTGDRSELDWYVRYECMLVDAIAKLSRQVEEPADIGSLGEPISIEFQD